ncbi:MAG: carboxypeptidase-like regulatory domain-containing protein [Planctomycetota bacterium]|nr:carboxypeptidase-like regulatory domain-containing protein [Planctomycetota bacterium]
MNEPKKITAGTAIFFALALAFAGVSLLPSERAETPLATPLSPRAEGSSGRATLAAARGFDATEATAEEARTLVATTDDSARVASKNGVTGPRLCVVEITVADAATGRPVPDAGVELVFTPGVPGSETERNALRTGPGGSLRVALPAGALEAVAWSDASAGGPVEARVPDGGTLRLVVRLREAGTVVGRVLDAETGAPFEGATVGFWTFAELDRVRTGPDGRFEHPRFPLARGGEQVRVEAPGYGSAVRYLAFESDGSWQALAPHAGEPDVGGFGAPARIEIALLPELRLSGRVVDPYGDPIGGAAVSAEGYVRILPSVASRDAASTRAGEDGRFALARLRSDVEHTLIVDAPGFARRAIELRAGELRAGELSVGGGHDLRLGDVVLEPEALLAGVVLDPLGQPVEDIGVELAQLTDEGEAEHRALASPLDAGARIQSKRWRTRSGRGGTILFEGLSAGRYELRVRRDRGVLVRATVELAAGEVRDGVRVDLPIEGFVLLGEVRDEEGAVVPGAIVAVTRFGHVARVRADAEGRFRVAGLDDVATYTVTAEHTDPGTGRLALASATVGAHEFVLLRLEEPESIVLASIR